MTDVEPHEDGPRLPHDLQAEMSVIGGILLSASSRDDVAEVLAPEDHYRPAHQLIHEAVARMVARGASVDAVSVADDLAKAGNLARAGGAAYLHECIAAVPTAANAGYYAEIVAAKAALRRLVQAGTRIVQLGYSDGNGDVDDIVDAAVAEVQAVAEGRLRDDEVSNEAAVYAAIESLERPIGLNTPWRSLTDSLAGWAPGWFYVCGARPGVGKTAFGCAVILDAAQRGSRSLMVSLEMPRDELYLRMLSNLGGVDGQRLLHRSTRDDDYQRLARAGKRISQMAISVDDRSNLSLAQIRARIRAEQRKGEVGVVVIDYLSLIRPPADAPRNDRRVQVDAIAQGLKNLARDLRVPIIALAQLNRGIEGRSDKIPTLSDLRESGGIEAAADVVMLMHRDYLNDPTALRITVPKNRHGPQALVDLDFVGQFSRITERGWSDVA